MGRECIWFLPWSEVRGYLFIKQVKKTKTWWAWLEADVIMLLPPSSIRALERNVRELCLSSKSPNALSFIIYFSVLQVPYFYAFAVGCMLNVSGFFLSSALPLDCTPVTYSH